MKLFNWHIKINNWIEWKRAYGFHIIYLSILFSENSRKIAVLNIFLLTSEKNIVQVNGDFWISNMCKAKAQINNVCNRAECSSNNCIDQDEIIILILV